MHKLFAFPIMLLICTILFAQNRQKDVTQKEDKIPPQGASQSSVPAKPAEDYSGMYSFLQEGEFLQLTVEDEGKVTGFVSRFGDLESDRGAFLDQFFKDGKLEGRKLSFTTETVHGVWYEFKGTVERGAGKNAGDEAYYVLKGMLTQNTTDASKRTNSKTR